MVAPVDGIQDPYLAILDIPTSEHLKLYNKEFVGIPKSDRYDLNRYKWTEFYQELKYAVSKFGLKAAVIIVMDRYGVHIPTEVKKIILTYQSITKAMVESHFKILWDNNPGVCLGCHPT